MFVENKRLKIRCFKYAALSMMLVVVIIVTSGCAALLMGKNRDAYNLLVEAADYFKYPSSVRIESGKMSGSGLYCVIKAKNGFGNYRSDTYYVSSSGYPLDDYDSRCYSDDLNCDLINAALAARFGVSTSNSSSKSNIGGSGIMLFLYFVILIVALCLHGLLCSKASDVANDKGYDKGTWFHMCFWLGPISFIIIAAMPDLRLREKASEMVNLQRKMIDALENTTALASKNAIVSTSSTTSSYTNLPEL